MLDAAAEKLEKSKQNIANGLLSPKVMGVNPNIVKYRSWRHAL